MNSEWGQLYHGEWVIPQGGRDREKARLLAGLQGTSEQVMDLQLVAEIHGFFVKNLRNSWLLRAILASNPRISSHNLNGPDLFRGSLGQSQKRCELIQMWVNMLAT